VDDVSDNNGPISANAITYSGPRGISCFDRQPNFYNAVCHYIVFCVLVTD
jgi:hypothetical protein